jgi:hypothetical protein
MNIKERLEKIFEDSYKITRNFPVGYQDKEYEVEAEIEVYRDTNYGADVDNNRGMIRTSVKDFEVIDMTDIETGKSVDPTPEMLEVIADKINDLDLESN